jgi:hypothetical protein
MVMQNLALMAQAIGLGGFPHWAAHPFGWLEALGFRMSRMPASRYLGMGPVLRFLAHLVGKDPSVGLALGLERDGEPLLAPFRPPYYPDMRAAVQAVVALKYGDAGIFREGASNSAWRVPERIAASVEPPDPAAVEATIAYCEYVYRRYARFPAYQPPFRTVLGFQANHVDLEFYRRFYHPDALSETQRRHMDTWHGGGT